MKIPELLAPVGSPDYLKTAINAGASSVYISGKDYGARKYAKNFTLEEIKNAVATAHLYNVKVYVTVNTLIRESELEEVINYLSHLYSIGVDAVLVQDLGLIELINKYLPDLKIHASTQMTVENQKKLDYLESKGVKRVVLPREMRSDEIASLDSDMELEMFVHGALCYSYSGQCLMSSFNGGRSGNRGMCAQPCRQKYEIEGINKKDYYLSPRDLNLYDSLDLISDLNIDCIKIEGRMRSKEYLAIVVSNYRQALNKLKSKKTHPTEELGLVFNRGFTEGQFKNTSKRSIKSGHIGLKIGKVINTHKNQIAIHLDDSLKTIPQKGDGLLFIKNNQDYGLEISQNPVITTLNHFDSGKFKQVKDLTRKNKVMVIKKVWQNKKNDFDLTCCDVYLSKRNNLSKKVKEIESKGKSYTKSKVELTFSIEDMKPKLAAKLTRANKKTVEVIIVGNKPFEKPLKKSVSRETIKKQLLKVDNYPYDITQVNINYDGTLFIPISVINNLRRSIFEDLKTAVSLSGRNYYENIKLNKEICQSGENSCSISYYTNRLEDLKNIEGVERVYLEIPPIDDSLVLKEERYNLNYMINFLKDAINISKDKDYELIWKWPGITHDKLIKALNKVRGILRKMNYELPVMSNNFNSEYAFYDLNVTNSRTVDSLENYKIITLSPELTKKDYEEIIKYTKNPEKIEILVQGSVELMKSRYQLLYGRERKNHGNYLIDLKNNKYPVHKSISAEELTIFSDSELSLINEIKYLKNIGFSNFSIDGRFKSKDYYKIIDIYKDELDENKNKNKLLKYSLKNSDFNFNY